MRKRFIVCLFLLLLAPMHALANGVISSTDLIEQAQALDGQWITYAGEVIGDVLVQGDHGWVNVSDGVNAMGIWADRALLGGIDEIGRYGQTGDTVQVSGIFHRSCKEHGGDMDIHAATFTRISRGVHVPVPVSAHRGIAASALLLLDGLLLFVQLRRKRIWRNR